MFQNITTSYSGSDATIEITIMLLGAFILWWTLAKCFTSRGEDNEETLWIVPKETSYISQDDDLKLIEWVGPAIEKLLYKYGVRSYSDMVEEGATGLEEILESWGAKYKIHNPSTWPDQAQLAHDGKWSELEEYQEILKGWVKKK